MGGFGLVPEFWDVEETPVTIIDCVQLGTWKSKQAECYFTFMIIMPSCLLATAFRPFFHICIIFLVFSFFLSHVSIKKPNRVQAKGSNVHVSMFVIYICPLEADA